MRSCRSKTRSYASHWVRKAASLVAVCTLASCLGTAATTASPDHKWTTEKVGYGVSSSIALDSNGNLHIAYLTADAKLMYAFRPQHAQKWYSIEILGSTHVAQNIYPRIALDKQDHPHVCVAMGTLQYLSYSNGGWTTQEVDPNSGTLSYHCSIAIGPDDTPHLTWYHEYLPGGQQFTHMRHAELVNGQWVVRSVDGGISGKWNSMVIDAEGNPHVSYSQWSTGGDIRYAAWDGKEWKIQGLPQSSTKAVPRGWDNSLALGPDGSPYISYFDEGSLRYAHFQDGKWTVEKVTGMSADYDHYRGATAIVLDSKASPHILFGDLNAVKHAYWDGKAWQVEVLDSGAIGQYANVDATIGADDTIYATYADPDGTIQAAIGHVAASATPAATTTAEAKQ